MIIHKHKSPLLNTKFETICDPFEFNFGGKRYFVHLKISRTKNKIVYASISNGILILGNYKIKGLHSVPRTINKLEILAYSVFAHYLSCELYNV